MKKVVFILLTLVISLEISGQCTNKLNHTTGTVVVSGTSVSVSSAGQVLTNTSYCPSTSPYYIGYDGSFQNANGSYTFNFTPAIDSLTLNFSGINKISVGQPVEEQVILTVNGLHYPITAKGTSNGCDSMAIITPQGNITGCECGTWGTAGWNETTIIGPITSITVLDSVVSGDPNGSIFSIFISDGLPTSIDNTEANYEFNISPNPTNGKIIISKKWTSTFTKITVFNAVGQLITKNQFIGSENILLDLSNSQKGLYYLHIETEKGYYVEKVIKQ